MTFSSPPGKFSAFNTCLLPWDGPHLERFKSETLLQGRILWLQDLAFGCAPPFFFLAKWPWGFIFKMACQETLFYCTLTTNSFLLFTFGALLNFDVFSYHNWFRTGKFPWVVERPSPVQREEGPLAGNVERSQHTCQS